MTPWQCQRARPTTRDRGSRLTEPVALPLSIGQVSAQLFFAPTHRDHKTNPVAIFHRASPTFTRDVAPDGPARRRAAALFPRIRRIEKKLRPAFREQNLRDAMPIVILKDPRPACAKIRKTHRHIEMFELV